MNKNMIRLPYIPLKANGLDLCAFGGAEVVYGWCRGAPVQLMHRIYQNFNNNTTCMVLITSEWYHYNDLVPEGDARTLHFSI